MPKYFFIKVGDKAVCLLQNVFLKDKLAQEASTYASFMVANNIAKHILV